MHSTLSFSFILFPWKQNKDSAKEDEPQAKKPSAFEMVSFVELPPRKKEALSLVLSFLMERKNINNDSL